jgi:hypothetical protein
MKFLKKGLLIFLIMLVPMMALTVSVHAEEYEIPDYMGNKNIPGSDFSLIGFVKTLINWYFYALLVVALFLLINVGYTYVTANGDTKKTGKAAQTLGYILMGIAIALIAKGLIYAACHIVTGSSGVCTFW